MSAPWFRCISALGMALLVASGLPLHAQRYFFENISVQQGLSASKVYAVVQDPTGMVWIGTETGLASYDGNDLINHGSDEGVSLGGARTLLVDSQGGIWAGHLDGGITHFDGGRFKAFVLASDMSSAITGMAQHPDGKIWVATAGHGAWRFKVPARKDQLLEAEMFGQNVGLRERLLGVEVLSGDRLCFIEDGGLVKELRDGRAVDMDLPGVQGIFQPTALFEDSRQALWVATAGGGAFRYMQGKEPQRFDPSTGLPSGTVFCFGEDGQGRVWLGTMDKGAAMIENGKVRVFDRSNGLHGSFVRCITRDREGNLLIGTNESGLDIFKGERFQSFEGVEGMTSDLQVWAVMEDSEGRHWFGTDGGIIIISERNGKTTSELLTAQQGRLHANFIRSLREDDAGHVWIGTENGGLQRYDPRTGRAVWDIELSGTMAAGRITALEVGQPGELWVGGVNGLRRYVPGSGGVPTIYREEDGLAHDHVTCIHRDSKGVIWVGVTMNGLSRVDNGQASAVDMGRNFTPNCIEEDSDGRLWVGTEGQGILVLENGSLMQQFTVHEGLLSNTIKAIGRDKHGQMWIGTNKGLNKWRPSREGFIAFTERAGFTGIEVKPNAVWTTRSGDLWFGTANGATRVGSDRIEDEPVPPLVAIRGWKVNLEDRDLEPGVSMPHNDRSIRISYGSVALSDPGAVRYSYMLKGLDDDWQPITTATEAYYPALPPARYVFQVKAMDRTGVWSEPPADITFTILPPWYRSWWFYTALILTLSILVFSWVKVRERQLRMRNLVLERKVDERTAEVVAQSKEIEGQKERIEDLLLNILPREISEELKEKGKATARRHQEVSVLFTDFKGFTNVAERMSPEELVNELHDCFIGFDDIVGRYGIEKIKTIGDAYMCACGVPGSDRFHAIKCVLAGLEIRELMERWRKERVARGETPWSLRIGIHSGPVVAGVVGKRKFAYDIWGDTVNTASRMESSGEPGQLNISGHTHDLVKDFFVCEHRGQVAAKNKGNIDMYFVRRIKPEFSADKEGLVPNTAMLETIGLPLVTEELA